MKTVALELFHLTAPLAEPIGNALVTFDRRETLLVRLTDAAGTAGWGESWTAPETVAALIARHLAPCVLGQDPQALGRLWRACGAACGPHGQGLTGMAVAAVDMALHDLAARQRGVPVATLLGGAVRERVPAYASGPFFAPGGHPYRHYQRECEGYLRAGFRAIKLRCGLAPAEDGAVAQAVRALLGPERGLMVDFNQSYTPRAAIEAARRMEAAELGWIEEPAAPGDLAGYRLAAGHVRPAIAGGETFEGAAAFLPFLGQGVMDVLQPDLAVCGGFEGVRRVVMLAELHQLAVVPHVWGSLVNFHAALHLAATLPVGRWGGPVALPMLEYDVGPNPLLSLLGRPELGADGAVAVPQGPGLGFELDPGRLAPFVTSHRVLRVE
ncbi:Mandelate racemase/muconate lactonizing enzyme family protein [Rhodovastum atsumiense]|uniref:Mandelate racemase/muconate lactonizing enzyme family protein n=1 Tax=Rhodovastum atsumiense TaxID=504468 RepID=A0A5M6IT50_9PROT|nr:mandelate racemase/muconate lactonizing enzyme family protein [Rhodovastum atsumiense]KAA5611391.1 mandelate racemase/muconate lactonizing enzyme family protein [Rhodovastum atsumiense]CAH2603600.1 Mandelate racemase/muconate lactonizing enzyme family protein [Rhodovastum atsumiense]